MSPLPARARASAAGALPGGGAARHFKAVLKERTPDQVLQHIERVQRHSQSYDESDGHDGDAVAAQRHVQGGSLPRAGEGAGDELAVLALVPPGASRK